MDQIVDKLLSEINPEDFEGVEAKMSVQKQSSHSEVSFALHDGRGVIQIESNGSQGVSVYLRVSAVPIEVASRVLVLLSQPPVEDPQGALSAVQGAAQRAEGTKAPSKLTEREQEALSALSDIYNQPKGGEALTEPASDGFHQEMAELLEPHFRELLKNPVTPMISALIRSMSGQDREHLAHNLKFSRGSVEWSERIIQAHRLASLATSPKDVDLSKFCPASVDEARQMLSGALKVIQIAYFPGKSGPAMLEELDFSSKYTWNSIHRSRQKFIGISLTMFSDLLHKFMSHGAINEVDFEILYALASRLSDRFWLK